MRGAINPPPPKRHGMILIYTSIVLKDPIQLLCTPMQSLTDSKEVCISHIYRY